MVFGLFIAFVILLRIGELRLSKRNERWLLERGAVEYGNSHYPFIVGMHVLFFISMIVEYAMHQQEEYSVFLLCCYAFFVGFRIWVILSLGKFWNTKIYRIPEMPLVKTGPYKYIKHPNYLVVTAELAVAPLAFHLYYTAVTFALLNAIILTVRIKEENKALLI